MQQQSSSLRAAGSHAQVNHLPGNTCADRDTNTAALTDGMSDNALPIEITRLHLVDLRFQGVKHGGLHYVVSAGEFFQTLLLNFSISLSIRVSILL